VLEVKTFRAPTQEARQTDLAEALEFTRANLAAPGRPRGCFTGGPAPGQPHALSGRLSPGQPAGPVRDGCSPAEHQPLTTH